VADFVAVLAAFGIAVGADVGDAVMGGGLGAAVAGNAELTEGWEPAAEGATERRRNSSTAAVCNKANNNNNSQGYRLSRAVICDLLGNLSGNLVIV
jgi:hypothetical protein